MENLTITPEANIAFWVIITIGVVLSGYLALLDSEHKDETLNQEK